MSEGELFRILYAAGVTVAPAPDGVIDVTGPLTPFCPAPDPDQQGDDSARARGAGDRSPGQSTVA
jgi:hypothetical protein